MVQATLNTRSTAAAQPARPAAPLPRIEVHAAVGRLEELHRHRIRRHDRHIVPAEAQGLRRGAREGAQCVWPPRPRQLPGDVP